MAIVSPINKNMPLPKRNPVPGGQTTTAPATGSSAPPQGVNPASWANPTWRATWLKQNPGYQPAGGTVAPAPMGKPSIAPTQGSVPPGVNPASWANPIFRATWMKQNPGWAGGTTQPITPGMPVPKTPAPAPGQPTPGGIPPGVNPASWANPVFRATWLKQHPEWNPAPATPAPVAPATPAPQPNPPGLPPRATGPAVQAPAIDPFAANNWKGSAAYFNPETDTVQGQMKGLLESDNPLMLAARSKALQEQNASGRYNTTMAGTAGDSAMYQVALGIATPDAQASQAAHLLDADMDMKKDMAAVQARFEQMALDKNLTSQEKQQMTATLGGLFGGVQDAVYRTLSNKDLDAAAMEATLSEIYRGYQDTVATYSDLFGFDIDWGWSDNNAAGG